MRGTRRSILRSPVERRAANPWAAQITDAEEPTVLGTVVDDNPQLGYIDNELPVVAVPLITIRIPGRTRWTQSNPVEPNGRAYATVNLRSSDHGA